MKTRYLGRLHSIGTHRDFSQTTSWRPPRHLGVKRLWGILSMTFLVMTGVPWSIPIAGAAEANECVIALNSNTPTCQGVSANPVITSRSDRNGSETSMVGVKLVKQESSEDAVMASLTRRINVNLAVPFQPEDLLASEAEVQAQRDEIARVQEQFISELWQAYQASHGVGVNNTVASPPISTQEEFMRFFDITPLRGLPFLVMQINDPAVLDEIVQHPLVADIEIDSFPLSEESVVAENASTSADNTGDNRNSRASSTRAIELPKSVLLEVAKAGTGTGSIRSGDGVINCGTKCQNSYPRNSLVTLTASPATGSTFTTWSGQCSGSNATTRVSMETAKKCVATFTLVPMSISGTVWKDLNGDGVLQDNEPRAGAVKVLLKSADVPEVSTVTDSNGNYKFANLTRTGNYSLSVATDKDWIPTVPATQTKTYEVSLTPGQSVTQKDFGIAPAVTLTVTVIGNGEVFGADKLIQCKPDCQETYPINTVVTLMAKAADNAMFERWGGACEGVTDTTCQLKMNQSLNVEAYMVDVNTLRVKVVWPRVGNVKVLRLPPWLPPVQGANCTNNDGWLICKMYPVTSVVKLQLVATPNTGYGFIKWLGDDCAGSSSSCSVKMDQNRTATACMGKVTVDRTGGIIITSKPPECQ